MFIKNFTASMALLVMLFGASTHNHLAAQQGQYSTVLQDQFPDVVLASTQETMPSPDARPTQAEPSIVSGQSQVGTGQNYFGPTPAGGPHQAPGCNQAYNGCHHGCYDNCHSGCYDPCHNNCHNGCYQGGYYDNCHHGCYDNCHHGCHDCCHQGGWFDFDCDIGGWLGGDCCHDGWFGGGWFGNNRQPNGRDPNGRTPRNGLLGGGPMGGPNGFDRGQNRQGGLWGGLFGSDENNSRYIRTLGGWNVLDDYQGTANPPPPNQNGQRRGEFNDGWCVGGVLGRRVSQNRRRELEFAFRDNTGNNWMFYDRANNPVSVPFQGRIQSYAIMGNLIHDCTRVNIAGWRPYLGGGIGFVNINGDFVVNNMNNVVVNESAFAFQGFGGLQRRLGRNVSCYCEYRFFGATEVELNYGNGMFVGNLDYSSQNLLVGFTIGRQ